MLETTKYENQGWFLDEFRQEFEYQRPHNIDVYEDVIPSSTNSDQIILQQSSEWLKLHDTYSNFLRNFGALLYICQC